MIVKNRYSGETFHEIPDTGAKEARNLMEKGHHSSREMAELPKFRVSQSLHSISENIVRRSGDLATTISTETGKTIRQSRVEVEKASQAFLTAAEEMKNIEGASLNSGTQRLLNGHIAFSSIAPLGLIISINPFTEPLYSVASRTAAALATGNSLILKPSSIAPMSTAKLIEIIGQSEFPQNSVQAVYASRGSKVMDLLFNGGLTKLVSFCGRKGNIPDVLRKARQNGVLIESGSSSPAIVWDDADLDAAAESVVNSAFNHQGQAHVRAQNIIIKKDAWEYFRNRLVELVQQLKAGNPLDENTDYGPLIDETAAIETEKQLKGAMEEAGFVVAGGIRDGSFFEPTILENVKPTSTLVRDQLLAPVISLHEAASFNEAVQIANASGPVNQASIFTSDINLAVTAFDKLDSGVVSINEAPGLPAEYISSGNQRGSITASKSMRQVMGKMIEERLAVLRR